MNVRLIWFAAPLIVFQILCFSPVAVKGDELSREERIRRADEFLVGKSPEEAKWYRSIRWNLRMNEAMAYVQDDPALPRVLLIGDSISIGYTLPVRQLLAGEANVHRIPANGGESARGIEFLDDWLGSGEWAVIHFNFGIHDLKHIKDGKWDLEGEPVSNPDIYAGNLRELVGRLRETGAELIWASTTHIPEGAPGVPANGELELNRIAKEIMIENGIRINDLHAHLDKRLREFQRTGDVHFSAAGSRYLAEAVVEHIRAALKAEE